jgi:hypothetical protein
MIGIERAAQRIHDSSSVELLLSGRADARVILDAATQAVSYLTTAKQAVTELDLAKARYCIATALDCLQGDEP